MRPDNYVASTVTDLTVESTTGTAQLGEPGRYSHTHGYNPSVMIRLNRIKLCQKKIDGFSVLLLFSEIQDAATLRALDDFLVFLELHIKLRRHMHVAS